MKKSIFFGLGALLALGATSCSKDDMLMPGSSTPLEEDQTFFTNISVNTIGGMTRSANDDYEYNNGEDPKYDYGKPYESNVKSVYFVFYDETGQRVATTQPMKDINNGDFAGTPNGDSEGTVFQGVVRIDVKRGMLPPSQVLCFINPITATNFDINPEFATIERAKTATRDFIIDTDDNFAMSKSVYYKEVGTNKFEKVVATPIADTQLFPTEAKAKEALEAETSNSRNNTNSSLVNIYVERYAAKVELDAKNPTINLIEDVTNPTRKLRFVPDYWCVNAYESKTYAIKSFLDNTLTADLDYDYLSSQMVNAAGDKVWKWNSPENHRSFWAQSPAYYTESYPRNADDIKDEFMVYANGNSRYSLSYYSYNEVAEMAQVGELSTRGRKVKGDNYDWIYVRENTVSGTALHRAAENPLASPKAAIGSVVLTGHYVLDGTADDAILPGTCYVQGNATNGYRIFLSESEAIPYFVNSSIRLYADAQGKTEFFNYRNSNYGFKDVYGTNYSKQFVMKHPDFYVRRDAEDPSNEYFTLDSRFVGLQIDLTALNDSYPIYVELDGKIQKVTEGNIDEVNRQILYASGTVQGYKNGLAFFSIPIKHLGYYREGNPNKNYDINQSEFDWNKVCTGDFGIVRNHSYKIQVNSISGLGNGIPDPNDPIVPPTDPEEYFIGARLIILNWAVVPTQSVDL